jgi:hypothetical protein
LAEFLLVKFIEMVMEVIWRGLRRIIWLVDVGNFAKAVKAKQGATTNTLNQHRP